MTKRTVAVKWLVFTVFYVVGGIFCVALGIAWYQNEKNIRMSEMTRRVELSLKPVTMVAEIGVSALNYYILDNEDFIRLFHLEQSLLFFSIEGISDTGDPFEFSYYPKKKIGSYSKYPKLYTINPGEAPERRAQKEELNRGIIQKAEEYLKQVGEFKRPAELNKEKMFYDSGNNRLYIRIILNTKNGGELWAVFDATEIAKINRQVLKTVIIVSFIIILILIVPAFFIAQLVARPLGRLVKQLTEQVETLDISTPLAVDTFLTEIMHVATSMNSFTEKLNLVISQAQKAAYTVGSGTSQQAAAVEETSASMEEMAAMTRRNADNSQQAKILVTEVSKEINLANVSMETLKRAMDQLLEASGKIAKIIKAIDEIAFQTNLLALNAAVEAARAGEAGAGFAVVAYEVRTLAQRATTAANSTSALIEDTLKKIKESSKLVVETNVAFEEVANRGNKVRALVEEIAAASQEQAQGIEQVTTALTEMDKATQQNAAQASELSNSMSIFTTTQGDDDIY